MSVQFGPLSNITGIFFLVCQMSSRSLNPRQELSMQLLIVQQQQIQFCVSSLLFSVAVPNNCMPVWRNAHLTRSLFLFFHQLPLLSIFTSVTRLLEAVNCHSLCSGSGVYSSAGPPSASEPNLLWQREKTRHSPVLCSCSFSLQAACMLLSGTSVYVSLCVCVCPCVCVSLCVSWGWAVVEHQRENHAGQWKVFILAAKVTFYYSRSNFLQVWPPNQTRLLSQINKTSLSVFKLKVIANKMLQKTNKQTKNI